MKKINFIGDFKGCVLSLILTLIFTVIVAVIYYIFDISPGILNIILFCVSATSLFLGGIMSGKKASKSGLINGMFTAFFYLIIILGISFLIKGGIVFTPHLITLICADIASSMLGGIVGINQ